MSRSFHVYHDTNARYGERVMENHKLRFSINLLSYLAFLTPLYMQRRTERNWQATGQLCVYTRF